VIVTAGGATDDFVDDGTGYRIPARKQVFGNRCISGLKTVGDLWMLEPDVDALTDTLTRVFQKRDDAVETGKRARAKVEASWTWKGAAAKATARMQVLAKAPTVRHQTRADAAVLIDGVSEQDLDFVIESLQRHTYASVAAFVRCPKGTVSVQEKYPQIAFVSDQDFNSTLQHVRGRVRTPYLAVVTHPLRFSKHWLSQLASVAQSTSQTESIVLPDLLDQCNDVEDNEFQRQARTRWRERRGAYRAFDSVFPGCALVTWKCLSREFDALPRDAKHWLSQLRDQGVPTYHAEDTCVAMKQAERLVHTR